MTVARPTLCGSKDEGGKRSRRMIAFTGVFGGRAGKRITRENSDREQDDSSGKIASAETPEPVGEVDIRPRNTAAPRCPTLARSALGPLSNRFIPNLIISRVRRLNNPTRRSSNIPSGSHNFYPSFTDVGPSRCRHYVSSLYRLPTRSSTPLFLFSPYKYSPSGTYIISKIAPTTYQTRLTSTDIVLVSVPPLAMLLAPTPTRATLEEEGRLVYVQHMRLHTRRPCAVHARAGIQRLVGMRQRRPSLDRRSLLRGGPRRRRRKMGWAQEGQEFVI
ncbi:hypothetical protein BJ912DRAFT_1075260 [Pholiota molesta]|nr:hypothetical protein BJ912DRAFT_1075260 [Pholiota molesta]